MKNTYIYKVNLVVEDDIENLETQDEINNLIESLSEKLSEKKAKYVSVQIDDLSVNENYGKCFNCGAWTSDFREEDAVQEFSNGAIFNHKWYCDLCLPKDHENHF